MTTLVGVGIDVVDVERLAHVIDRRPSVLERVFTAGERGVTHRRSPEGLAARFAAKEAVMKALGVGLGAFALRDVEVVTASNGQPTIQLHHAARALADRLGVATLQVSLTHTSTLAAAVVIAEGPS